MRIFIFCIFQVSVNGREMISLPVLAPGVYVGQATSKYIRVTILILYLPVRVKTCSVHFFKNLPIAITKILYIYNTWKTEPNPEIFHSFLLLFKLIKHLIIYFSVDTQFPISKNHSNQCF